jgi:hypothetical protein
MAGSVDTYDLAGIIIQTLVFALALVFVLCIELVEQQRSRKRRDCLTNFTPTDRLSHSPSEDDFLSNIRENIIKRTMA